MRDDGIWMEAAFAKQYVSGLILINCVFISATVIYAENKRVRPRVADRLWLKKSFSGWPGRMPFQHGKNQQD